MTEPDPVTEPDPTLDELNRMILEASRKLTVAILTRPRDQARIDAARAELEYLRDLKAQLYPDA